MAIERAESPPRPAESTRSQTATATCPFGTWVTGGGGAISGQEGRVVMDRIVPDPTLRSVTVGATENRDGTLGLWTVRAYAICSVAPPGLQLITGTKTGPLASNQTAFASCPAGKKLIGAGGELIGANGRIVMSRITPSNQLTGVSVTSLEDGDPTAIPWSVRAYAICAAPLAGLIPITQHSDWRYPDNPNYATATCPSGTRVIGAGGEVVTQFSDDVGDALIEGHQQPTAITPDPGLTSVRVTGYDGQIPESRFDARAIAICAKPPGPVAPFPGGVETRPNP
jgi:hypothetical protein